PTVYRGSTYHWSRMEATHLPHNLPASLTPFVGRDAEYDRLLAYLREPACRLLTITGVGGVGKTRLALQVAHGLIQSDEQALSFVHGVYRVPLAALVTREPLEEALAAEIACALDMVLSGPESPSLQVRHYLREKDVLLLLDNFEHLIAGTPFLADLLQGAPGLKILATSRERLNLRGEWVIALEGLPFPPAGHEISQSPEEYDAIALFTSLAQAVAPDFALTDETTPAVVRICQLVAGVPLAIELAASWTRFLSCAEIADEIDRSLDFLASAPHDVPQRQQSLRAVFTSSWSLLSPMEQQALRRLAVFRGSFTREAAATVAGVSLPLLAALTNKSLVRHITGEGGAARFEVLEVLRQFAAERLDQSDEAETMVANHAAYYLDFLASRTTDLRGPNQQDALATIRAEMEQVRAAWQWAVTAADGFHLGQAAEALFHVYDMQSWFGEGAEAFGAASRVLKAQQETPDITLAYGKVLARQGWFTFHLGRQREAKTLLEQSLTILRGLDAQADMVFTLNYLGVVCAYLGEDEATRTLCQESLELAQSVGNAYGEAIACNILGQTAYDRGAYVEAKAWCQQSLAIEQRIGNRWSMAFSLTTLGKVASVLGEHAEARRLFEQSLQIRQEMGDIRGVAICFDRLGDTAMALGNLTEAREHYEQSFVLFREIGNQWGMAMTLILLGQLALTRQQHAVAVRLLQEALRLALETAAVPQVVRLLEEFAQLVRQGGEPAWADELVRLATMEPVNFDNCREQAVRLLAWSWPEQTGQDMTLDHALIALRGEGQLPTVPKPHDVATPSQPPYPASLTPREVEVLRLVAQGLTDAQVAEELIISPRTVSTHLTSIYGKLQVNSRTAAARFAVEHGLA
ncbi:MAG: tetratricopeptide repeat protein, partial [Chloroflexota bacterium]|nr:tetratricopeptide repeat protein [Chloroflexota bacterium]